MNVQQVKQAAPRFDTAYHQRLNLQAWGNDNLYPQHLSRIAAASGTAELCLSRYCKFVEGNGFMAGLEGKVLNESGETADDLLHRIAQDVSRYSGFALHVNYNLLGEVVEINHVPFEVCRLEECDDAGHVQHIITHPDWIGRKTKNGKRITVDEQHVEHFNVFNPNPEAVREQILRAGGIDRYNGQILWCSMAGKNIYPTPIYDAVISDMSTEEGLGNIKNRNARNNFLVSAMLVTKKGSPKFDQDGNDISTSTITPEDLAQFQGDERMSKLLLVELENDEDKPEVVPFTANNYDKDFTATDASVIERIYAQFHQELFYAIRIGKLGFSGNVMADAYTYYAGEVTIEQRFISRGLSQLLEVWHEPILRNADTTILPIKYAGMNNE
jgi:hypothetical protein